MPSTPTKKTPAKRAPAKKTAAPRRAAPAAPKSTHTPARHIRIDDSIWTAASESCSANGYAGMTDLIRSLLRDHNAGKRMQ